MLETSYSSLQLFPTPKDSVQLAINVHTPSEPSPAVLGPESMATLSSTPNASFGSSQTYQDISTKLQILHRHLEFTFIYLQDNPLSPLATEFYLLNAQAPIAAVISECLQLKAALLSTREDAHDGFRADILKVIGGSQGVIAKEWQKLLREWEESGFEGMMEEERIWLMERPVLRALKIVEYWVASLIHPLAEKKDNLEVEEDEVDLEAVATALLRELEDWEKAENEE